LTSFTASSILNELPVGLWGFGLTLEKGGGWEYLQDNRIGGTGDKNMGRGMKGGGRNSRERA
jgi:hypothetical protein